MFIGIPLAHPTPPSKKWMLPKQDPNPWPCYCFEDKHINIDMFPLNYILSQFLFLICSVLLRQNPHNVHEWHKRVKLYEGKPNEIINTYTEAVQTVNPKLASGKPHTLWVEFAKFYEKYGQLTEARLIFDKATKVNYRKVDDLAAVWCEFGEMEIRHEWVVLF